MRGSKTQYTLDLSSRGCGPHTQTQRTVHGTLRVEEPHQCLWCRVALECRFGLASGQRDPLKRCLQLRSGLAHAPA